MESLRKDSIVRELETGHELEFPSGREYSVPGLTDAAAQERAPILHLVLDNRQLLFRVAVRALIISVIVALILPRKYESTISIIPPDSLGGGGNMLAALAAKASPGLAAMAGNFLGMSQNPAVFTTLLRSRTVQSRVVDRFDLQKEYKSRYEQDACRTLAGRTEVEEDRKSGVIFVTVSDPSPQRARDLAQAYVEELNRLVSGVSTSSARRERIFIEQRLTTVKADLEDAEKQFSAFASKNTALDIKEQTRAMVDSAAILQGQMMAAESELRGLQQIYSTNNVRVRALQARVDDLTLQLQKLGGTDASLVEDKDQSNELYPSIRKLPLLGVEWADLYRRMKIQETVYELLNQQYELARIEEAKEIPTVNVIDPADLPQRKSFPPRRLIVFLAIVLAVAGTVAWIAASTRIERLDLKDPRKRLIILIQQRIDVIRARCARNPLVVLAKRYLRPFKWAWNFGKA